MGRSRDWFGDLLAKKLNDATTAMRKTILDNVFQSSPLLTRRPKDPVFHVGPRGPAVVAPQFGWRQIATTITVPAPVKRRRKPAPEA